MLEPPNGRAAKRKGHRGASSHLTPPASPQAQGQWQLPSQVGKGFAPQPVLWPSGPFSTRPPNPHLLPPYQIAWASFINARLLGGGGAAFFRYLLRDSHSWGRAPLTQVGDCGECRAEDKARQECAGAPSCAFSPDKMERGWGGAERELAREKAAAPLMYF